MPWRRARAACCVACRPSLAHHPWQVSGLPPVSPAHPGWAAAQQQWAAGAAVGGGPSPAAAHASPMHVDGGGGPLGAPPQQGRSSAARSSSPAQAQASAALGSLLDTLVRSGAAAQRVAGDAAVRAVTSFSAAFLKVACSLWLRRRGGMGCAAACVSNGAGVWVRVLAHSATCRSQVSGCSSAAAVASQQGCVARAGRWCRVGLAGAGSCAVCSRRALRSMRPTRTRLALWRRSDMRVAVVGWHLRAPAC
jgi:hypothetical protein